MKTITKIACRTIGALGMGVALYDATKVAGLFSRNKAQVQHANYLEDVYYNSRTLDTVSYSSNGIRKTTANVMGKNPLPRIWGRIKGAFQGATYSLGNNLLAIAFMLPYGFFSENTLLSNRADSNLSFSCLVRYHKREIAVKPKP